VGHEVFAVLKPIVRDNQRGILIWAGHSNIVTDRAEYLAELERLATMVEGAFIELWTARKGFARVLPHFGFTSRRDQWCGTPVTVWTKLL
jgi:hypothetical protein